LCSQPEFAHPYDVLSPHCDLVIASPEGGATICDPVSVELFKNDKVCVDFKDTKESLWMNTEKLESFLGKAKEFDTIFYVGGFGRKFCLRISSYLYLDTHSLTGPSSSSNV
jgi:hypothetical protein